MLPAVPGSAAVTAPSGAAADPAYLPPQLQHTRVSATQTGMEGGSRSPPNPKQDGGSVHTTLKPGWREGPGPPKAEQAAAEHPELAGGSPALPPREPNPSLPRHYRHRHARCFGGKKLHTIG